jgi:hypothetical protein
MFADSDFQDAIRIINMRTSFLAPVVTPTRQNRGAGFHRVLNGPSVLKLHGRCAHIAVPADTSGPLFDYIRDVQSQTLWNNYDPARRAKLLKHLSDFRAYVREHHVLADSLRQFQDEARFTSYTSTIRMIAVYISLERMTSPT